jgi:hypothetical protein
MHRSWRIAAALGVAAVAVLAGGPSGAAAGRTHVVVAQSPLNSTDTKVVRASCLAGEMVYGGGGRING